MLLLKLGYMCHSSWGGSTRIAVNLAGEMALRGHEVHLFTLSPLKMRYRGEDLVKEHFAFPWSHIDCSPATLYTEWRREFIRAYRAKVIHAIKRHGLDILHYHYAVPFAEITKKIKAFSGFQAPWIIGTLHGTDVSNAAGDDRSKLARSLKSADILTTVSCYHASLAERNFRLEEPPTVLPNFTDFHTHPVGGRLKWSRKRLPSKPRIIHISNFRPVKNPMQLVEIFAGIRRYIDADLWLVGDGPLKDEVNRRLRAKKLGPHVRHFGLTHDVGSLIAESDLLLVTSKIESFCLVALEAMVIGVPVLATDVGGLPELVDHGKTGLLYPIDSPQTAVNQAIEVLSNPAQWKRIARAALDKARKYNIRDGVSNYEKIYRELSLPYRMAQESPSNDQRLAF